MCLVGSASQPPADPSPTAQKPAYSRWWLALTILLGQVTLAFSMFAVVVALPKIMSAMSADVTSIHWVMTGFQPRRHRDHRRLDDLLRSGLEP